MRPKTGIAPGYLHGYSRTEQERLYKQARFFEPIIFEKVDYASARNLLEVGSGVGAQTEILLERFPHLQVQGIDASAAQVKRARTHLSRAIKSGRARFDVGDALHLPYDDSSFDAAFICWFLEHVQEPTDILREVRRVLKTTGTIYCNEVLNATLYLNPYSPATLQYWFAFNDYQWTMKGDPFVGGKLANYLMAAGYQNISTEVKVCYYDNRMPKKRAEFVQYWTELLLSGAPNLLQARKVTPEIVEEMKGELERLKDDPDAVAFYSWIQARAQVF